MSLVWADQRCVVVGGAGAVGAVLATRLADQGAVVQIIDTALPASGRVGYQQGDILAMSSGIQAELRRAQVVALALPESVALRALPAVARVMAPGALLLNTLSVQVPIAAAGDEHAAPLERLGLNPMFAPSLDPRGRPVAAIVGREGPRVRAMLEVVASWGARVVRLSPDEHDRLAAATQGLTHAAILAFGFALLQLLETPAARFDVASLAAVAPPPHATLTALLARVVSGAPAVYWDVQAGNAQAALAREALTAGVRRLSELLETGEPAFTAALLELRDLFGSHLQPYRDHCAALFAHPSPGSAS